MSSTAELTTQTQGPDARRAEPASAVSWAEQDAEPLAGSFTSFFGGTSPEPPVAATARLVNHPLLAHPANRTVRAVALRRAQQTYGNHFVQRVLQRRCACGGTCEKCAAEESSLPSQPVTEENPKHIVQAQAAESGLNADAAALPADSVAQPLDFTTRRFMESRFGRDLADVRVHTDRPATESAMALGADAYTSGRDIYFAAGKYAPETADGQHLLAHELAHTAQQAEGRMPEAVAARGSEGLVVGRADDPMEEEAERAANAVTDGAAGTPAVVSADHAPGVRRQAAPAPEAKKDEGVLDFLGRKALEGAEATVNFLAPGVVPLLRGIGAYLTEKITAGIDSLFGGLIALVQKEGIAGALETVTGKALGGITNALGQLASGACQGLVAVASALLDLARIFVIQQIDDLRKVAGAIGHFFEEAWSWLGLPDFEAIKKAAGRAWAWVEEKAAWLWKKLEPVRKAGARFLKWLRETFELGLESADGLLESLRKKALAAWEKIKPTIQPILGPLKAVGTALFLLTPVGWTVLGVAAFWEGLKLAANVLGSHELKNAPAYLREHVLPLVVAGANSAVAALSRVCSFLSKVTGDVVAAVGRMLDALGGTALLKLARQAVGAAASFFDKVAAVAKGGICGLIEQGIALIHQYSGPIKAMLEALRQLALVVTLGPWAILDDGVWNTLSSFVTRALKIPCLREIGGFLHVPGALAQIDKARMFLKGVWRVVNNPEILKPEIDKALGGLVAKIPGVAKELVAKLMFIGPDAERHAEGVWRFLEPKISGLLSDWQGLLLGILGDLIWPWPGVKKDVDAIGKCGEAFWAALSELHFSKAVDELLAIWRGLNSIAGHLAGWFTLASVLVGAILGGIFGVGAGAVAGAAAGFAFAMEVGEALLLSTIAAEGLSIDKAQANLLLRSRRGRAAVPAAPTAATPAAPQAAGPTAAAAAPRSAPPTPEAAPTLSPDEQDYQQIAESMFNLAILGAMMVLGEIAVEFAKTAWNEIKGAFRGAPRETAVPTPGAAAEPGAAPKETPPAETAGKPPVEPAEPLPEDTAAKAEENGIPREQLEAEFNELRGKAADPRNVRRPADPHFDAEMDAGGHTFDREKASRSWCRFSNGVCDLSAGGDLNAKVDAAKERLPGEAPETGEVPKPATEAPTVKEPTEPTKPTEAADSEAAARADLEKKINDLKAKKAQAEAQHNELRKEAQQNKARADELERQMAIAKGEAKAKLADQLRQAREAAKNASEAADRAFDEAKDAQLDIQRKTAQLNADAATILPCFAAGTAVWTPNGPRPIEDIRVDDVVYTCDVSARATAQRRVLQVHRNHTMRFYHIEVSGANVLATSRHRFWVESEGGWVEARGLRGGMALRTVHGGVATVGRVEALEVPRTTTFNLSVEESSTYFVGPGVLVHNAGGPAYGFGNLRVYRGTNPRFPGKVYIGQTDDVLRRQGEHRAEAEAKLKEPNLSPKEREFWEFKRGIELEERVSGLNPDQADYLEQRGIDDEGQARGEENVMNRREQVSRKRMPELAEKIKADPKVQEAGLCP